MTCSPCSLRRWGPLLALSLALPLAHALARAADTADSAANCDWDGDGYDALVCDAAGDCNDGDPDVHPGAVEVPGDGLDQDCDGTDLLHTLTPGSGEALAGGAGTCGVAPTGGAASILIGLAALTGLVTRRRSCAAH